MDERRLRGPTTWVGSQDRTERLDAASPAFKIRCSKSGRPSPGGDHLFHESMRIGWLVLYHVDLLGLGLRGCSDARKAGRLVTRRFRCP